MKIQIIIQNNFGKFSGQVIEVDEDALNNLKKASTTFYHSGFEMTLEDGNFIVIPPSIVQNSILTINKVENVQEQI
jgi:hypothetical protein